MLGEIHEILLDDFSMQMSPKTVKYGGKNLGFGDGRFLQKNLGFGVGFGYRKNTTTGTHAASVIVLVAQELDCSHLQMHRN